MLAKASSRSASETSSTWSKRASALRTCEASVSGSLRCLGKAYTWSGSWSRSAVSSSPCRVWAFHVVFLAIWVGRARGMPGPHPASPQSEAVAQARTHPICAREEVAQCRLGAVRDPDVFDLGRLAQRLVGCEL